MSIKKHFSFKILENRSRRHDSKSEERDSSNKKSRDCSMGFKMCPVKIWGRNREKNERVDKSDLIIDSNKMSENDKNNVPTTNQWSPQSIQTQSSDSNQSKTFKFDQSNSFKSNQSSSFKSNQSNSFKFNQSNRLSVATIPNVPRMSKTQKRFSLSEFGFGKIESYHKFEVLGKGTYSTVYKGLSLLTKDVVALKEVKLEELEGAPCTAIREISLLRDLRHPNIVTLHDIIYQKHCLTLVFEYLDRNLKQFMDEYSKKHGHSSLDIETACLLLKQLLLGLEYCHARSILHRDLKPHNLLIGDKMQLKLADFGLARAASIPSKTFSHEVVTLWYRPPDLLLGRTEYKGHVDIWGAGCIFLEMLNGQPIFPGQSEFEQLSLIFERLGTPSLTQSVSTSPCKLPAPQLSQFPHTPSPNTLLHLLLPNIYTNLQQHHTNLDSLLTQMLQIFGENRLSAHQLLLQPLIINIHVSPVSIRSTNTSPARFSPYLN